MAITGEVKARYNKTYYEKNKEKLFEKRKELTHCKYCDKKVKNASMYVHKKSEKHLLNKKIYDLKNRYK